MKCLIIEDEFRALKHLESRLFSTGEQVQIMSRLDTVEESITWLKKNEADLIFMDVELGDGICFEIFEHVEIKTPVIFTTSYNEYISRAFDANSIAYLLKPVNSEELEKALKKYHLLYDSGLPGKIRQIGTDFQKRFLIHSGNFLQVLNADNIASFRVEGKRVVIATTTDNHQHLIDGSLEDIEKKTDPANFFRINRQLIINRNAIASMLKLDKGRVKIGLVPDHKEEAVVSVERAPAFKKWLEH